jgi:GrpB-like predicted nucleotidyltransferase (UPF0157 family)
MRFAGKVAARDLTRAVYSGLLERDPDEGGADAYHHAFQHGGDLADVIKCIVASTEFRERFMRQYAGDFLGAVYQGLLQRDPTPQELTGAVSSSADLAELLRSLGTSEEHWQAQFKRKATGLAHELADRLQADMRVGGADAPATATGGAVDVIVRRLAAMTQTDEYGAALFRRRAAAVVNELYSALLNRPADSRGLAVYTAQLTSPTDIGPIVKTIANSEEHWHRLIRGHAEQLVGLSFQKLLNRDPSAQELAEKTGALSTAAALGELLQTLSTSDEHWDAQLALRATEFASDVANELLSDVHAGEKNSPAAVPGSAFDSVVHGIAAIMRSDEYGAALFRRHAASVVNGMYAGLLNRSADTEGLAVYTAELTAPSDIGPIIQKIANSEEHWHTSIRGHADQLVHLSFQHLLDREPNSVELMERTGALTTTTALGELLKTLSTSEEHWKAQLARRLPDLAVEIANGLELDVRGGEEDASAGVTGSTLDGLVQRIAALTRSEAYGAALFRRHAASVVNDLYSGLLNRAADPEGLAIYTAELTAPAEIGAIVQKIANSEEHWHTLIRGHAEQLVGLAFQKLLNREPSAQEFAEKIGELSTAAALGELLKTLGTSEEHWKAQLAQNASKLADEIANRLELDVHGGDSDAPGAVAGIALESVVQRISALTRSDEYGAALFRRGAASVVKEIYLAVLNRAPEPAGLAVYTAQLTSASEIGAIIKEIANSEEHWHTLIRGRAEQLVRLSFQQLLGREPNSDELADRTAALSTPSTLGELLKTLGASDEHWKCQLERRATELADEIANELQSDAHVGDIDPPATDPGSSVDIVVRRIRALTRSDDYGRILFHRHAAPVVDELYLALLNRPADPEGLALYTEQLTTPAAIGSVVKNVLDSEEYRQRLVHTPNSQLVAAAYRCLLQRPATPEELARHTGEGIMAVLEALAQAEELWQLQLQRRAPALATGVPGLIAGIHAACSMPEPSPAELDLMAATLESPDDVRKLIGRLLYETVEAERSAATAPVVVSITALPPVSFLANWQTAAPSLAFVEGFNQLEGGYAWSSARSSVLVTARTNIFLSCNYLRPGESRCVTIESDGVSRTVTLDDAYACYQVEVGAEQPLLVRFESDGERIPSIAGSGADSRNLAFQLWPVAPASVYVANLPETEWEQGQQVIYCVFDSKKEEDTLQPLHDRLIARGSSSVFLSARAALEKFQRRLPTHGIFLIASSVAYAKLFNSGCRGHFIYTEHGASPLKAYTYNKHYKRYDLILLPGQMWVDRLTALYPELAARTHAVGYAKLQDSRVLSTEERAATCKRLGLNPAKKIILFAPSWSGGNRECGIFNLKHFARSDALFAIPHDGDRQFADELKNRGYLIHTPATGESISNYYSLADVLVSDVSSTAVEFSALGKPVLCIAMENIPDFDMSFRDADGRIRIPHTDAHWDFCPMVAPDMLNDVLTNLLMEKPRRSTRSGHSRSQKAAGASVAPLICAHGTMAADLAVDAILKFLTLASESLELRGHG